MSVARRLLILCSWIFIALGVAQSVKFLQHSNTYVSLGDAVAAQRFVIPIAIGPIVAGVAMLVVLRKRADDSDPETQDEAA